MRKPARALPRHCSPCTFCRLGFALLALALVAPCSPKSPGIGRTIPADFFGINGLAFLHYRDAADATQTARLRMDVIKDIGARWDRTDMWWGIVEPRPGEWTWTKTDWLMDYFAANDISVQPILNYSSKWIEPDAPANPEQFQQYANYANKVVARYKGKASAWEVWNEPNIPTFWKPKPAVDAYAGLLAAAYPAIKKADPGATVIGAVTSMTDNVFIERLAARGGLEHMDAISIHPYCLSDGPVEMDLHRQIRNVRTVLARHGRPDLPLWITETGKQADINKPDQVDEQARFIIQTHVICAAERIERLIWFCVQDWVENGELVGYGFLSPPPGNRLKPSAQAYRTTVDMLVGARFRGYVKGSEMIGYVFDNPTSTIMVTWTDRYRTDKFFPSIPARALDSYGRQLDSARPAITVTHMPTFIVWDKPAVEFRQTATEPPLRANLLFNPSFEDTESTQVYGWERGAFNAGSTKGTFTFSTTASLTGSKSAAIANATDATYMSFPIPALPGERYRLSGHVNKDSAQGGRQTIRLDFYGNSGWRLIKGPEAMTSATATCGWIPVAVEGSVPADADVVRVSLICEETPGAAYFDDLKLDRLPVTATKGER